jgi:hypothetical protein
MTTTTETCDCREDGRCPLPADSPHHGKAHAYSKGCRCDRCRAGWAAYMRAYKKRHRLED